MAITINGNGTITGISSGGLPAGSVTSATLADGAATQAKRTYAAGEIIQYVHTTTITTTEVTSSSYTDCAGFSLAITPTSSSNLLLCHINIAGCTLYDTSGSDHNAEFVLTDNGASSYIKYDRFRIYEYGSGYHLGLFLNQTFDINHIKTAGSTSARTYQLRVKLIAGEKIIVNNDSSAKSLMSITEIKV